MAQHPVKVLVADDDFVIRQFLVTGLKYEGYDVVEVPDGNQALALAARFQPDLVILDLMMPGADGYEVCRRLRGRPDLGILMLTARDDLSDRTQGLDLGADDYLVKPFHFEELLSRMRAILRRLDKHPSRTLEFGSLVLDEARHEVTLDGRNLELTSREFDLLHLLMRHPKQVLSRQTILDRVWGPEFAGGEANVDVCIASLRSKFGPAARGMLKTVRRVGFRLSS
jgi:two-component system response regulator MprA